jgi:hypothetical protein
MATPRTNPTPTQAAAQATKPKYFVINDVLYYQAKAGDELQFDLDFPGEVLEKVLAGEIDERDQFMTMLEMLGDEKMAARVRKMGALEQTRLITRFFAEFETAVGADLGESEGSSDS